MSDSGPEGPPGPYVGEVLEHRPGEEKLCEHHRNLGATPDVVVGPGAVHTPTRGPVWQPLSESTWVKFARACVPLLML